VDVRRERSSVVSQFSDVLGEDTRIPDGMKASISTIEVLKEKGETYFRILPSNLNIATNQLDQTSSDVRLTSITTLISTTEMEWLVNISQEMDKESK
jgi:hypothetical protein